MRPIIKEVLLSGATATGAGTQFDTSNFAEAGNAILQCKVVGTGAVTAQVKFQVSSDNSVWEDKFIFNLSGTTSDNAAADFKEAWPFRRGNVIAISGTGAAVTLNYCREQL